LVPCLALVLGLGGCDSPAPVSEQRAPVQREPIVAPTKLPPIAPALPPPRPVAADAWLAFASERWEFTAEFPGPPTTDVMSVPTVAGPLEMHMFTSELGGWAYMISVMDGPQTGKPVAPGKVLDGARDGAVANIRGKLLAEQQLEHSGLPARRLEIVATPPEGEQRVIGLLVLRERKLYQALVVAPSPAKELGAIADRFFATLKIAGK
jgi:hypothetical protein